MKYIFYLVAGNTYTTVLLALYLTLLGNKYITEGKNSDEERELDSYSEMLSLWKLEIVGKKKSSNVTGTLKVNLWLQNTQRTLGSI